MTRRRDKPNSFAERQKELNWVRGTTRTCPKCEKTFLTQKDKRIHKKAVHRRYA